MLQRTEIILLVMLVVMIVGGFYVIRDINKVGFQMCLAHLTITDNPHACVLSEFKPYYH